jgi:hypothetical protein
MPVMFISVVPKRALLATGANQLVELALRISVVECFLIAGLRAG